MSRARSAEQIPDDREQTTEDSKSQRAEVRGQRSEQPDDRGQRTEGRGQQKPEVGGRRSEVRRTMHAERKRKFFRRFHRLTQIIKKKKF